MNLRLREVVHLSLLALALALGGVLALDRGRPTTSELEARADNLVPVIRRDALTTLRIIDRTGKNPELVVHRVIDAAGSTSYTLGDLDRGAADLDPATVDGLLSALEFAKWHEPPRTLGAEEPPQIGALDLEVRLEMGAVQARLLMGSAAPSRPNLRQVEVTATGAPRRTGLVSVSLIDRLGRDRSAFESRLLLPVGRDRTETLTITHGERSVTLRSDGRGFVFTGPGGARRRVGRSALDRVFFQLARTTIEASLEPREAKAGVLEVRQETRASNAAPSSEYVLTLGGECPGHPELIEAHRAAPSELAGCVPASVLGGVIGALDGLEDRSFVPLGADEIDHLIVESTAEGAGRRLDLVRDGAEFLLRVPEERTVGLDTGNAFLEALLEARNPAKEVTGLTSTARLRVFGHPPGAAETAEFVVELLGEPGKASWSVARRLDDGALLMVDEATSWSLSEEASWFEDREILSIEPGSIRRFATITKDGNEQVSSSELGQGLVFPDGRAADRSLAGAALALLHPLTALRWLPPQTAAAPSAPLLVVEVAHGNEQEVRVVVESRVRGGYAAHVDGRRGRFVLPVRTVSTWLRSLVDRTPATLIPADYTKIVLTSGKLEHVLERRGEQLVAATEVDDGFGEAVGEALLGFVPIAARRGREPARSAPVLIITATATNGKSTTFRVHGPTTYEGVSAYEINVDSASRSYFLEAGVVQALLDLL